MGKIEDNAKFIDDLQVYLKVERDGWVSTANTSQTRNALGLLLPGFVTLPIPNQLPLPLSELRGDGTWPFFASVVGNDIVVRNIRATCFGGANDPQDSGETASGISTKSIETLGVALPRCYTGSNVALIKALGGSPIPAQIPFQTVVEVTRGDRVERFPFIDLGPAKKTDNAIDLTVASARKFNPNATATNFQMICSYRIINGAHYI